MVAEVSGSTYLMVNNITSYLELKEINERLLKENERLKSKAKEDAYYSLFPDRKYFSDTLYQKQYEFIGAKVVNSSVSNRNNYITINRGRLHGIKPEMGLITDKGVVGIVKDVSPHFSVALSLLNGKTNVGAKMKKNEFFGIVKWEGDAIDEVTLTDIPNHVDVQVGDTIVSRGESTLFPSEIPIGTVSSFSPIEGEIFFDIKVHLFEDFKNLHYCYAVENILKQEQLNLEEEAKNEN